jgi:hypothetical protein
VPVVVAGAIVHQAGGVQLLPREPVIRGQDVAQAILAVAVATLGFGRSSTNY